MDIAIVTGASSSLGLAISRRLIQLGLRVYGLGGDYTDCPLQNVNFRPLSCDLADPAAVEAAADRVLEKEKGVYALINNAKYFGRSPFFEMDAADIERVLRINLLCPLVLARKLAPSLKALQGYLIQLGAPYAETSRGGAAGAAASGGLKWMGEVLFQELRDHGVRVCHLSPEPNRRGDPRTAVRPGARTEAAIDPEAVAQAVEQILQSPFGNVVTELILRPLRTCEPDLEPVVRLPYPEPKPIPQTVPRELIEAEEQEEEARWEESQQRKRAHKSEKRQEKPKEKPSEAPDKPAEPPSPPAAPAPVEQPAQAARAARKRRRKPKPPSQQVGFVATAKPEPKAAPAPVEPKETDTPAAKPAPQADHPPRKSARKTPRKRAARKRPSSGKTGKDSA